METINDRLEILINERYGGNKARFAEAIDLAPTSMSSYISTKRRSKPNTEIVARIIRATGVSPYWLLLGEGDMYIDIPSSSSVTTTGDNSPAVINGTGAVTLHADNQVPILEERIKHLEALLAEKERMIQFLMERK